jgi:hypothetical protein
MENYQAVHQWAATVSVEKALEEIKTLKAKYNWLKCDETISTLEKMNADLPNIIKIIKLQEKQNAIHREFIRVNQIADEAIVKAVATKFDL